MKITIGHRFFFFFSIILSLVCTSVKAQPPSNYYANAYGKKGYQLRTALFQIINNHTVISYNGLWNAFYTTDDKPNGKVWDIYSDNPGGTTPYEFTFGDDQCGSYSAEGDCYNREHSVPKSWFGDASPMYSDLFHLYPTDGKVNGARGNFPYGEVGTATFTSRNGSKVGTCSTSGYVGTVFEPIDAYKGDLARSYFYMCTRYMNQNLGQDDNSMFTNGNLDRWALTMLISWHLQDPVSQKEIDRNNAVYQIQHNRNPFIDYPELVTKIFGADSVITFDPTGIDHYQLNDLVLYPNPATDCFNILNNNHQDAVTVYMYDITGKKLMETTPTAPSETRIIDISSFNNGLYIIMSVSKAGITTQKLIINHHGNH